MHTEARPMGGHSCIWAHMIVLEYHHFIKGRIVGDRRTFLLGFAVKIVGEGNHIISSGIRQCSEELSPEEQKERKRRLEKSFQHQVMIHCVEKNNLFPLLTQNGQMHL